MNLDRELRKLALAAMASWPVRPLVARKRLAAFNQALSAGLPEVLAEPLRYLATCVPPPEVRPVQTRVEALRRALPDARVRPYTSARPGGADLAHTTSVSREWGTFLHLCARSMGAGTILELGTAAGISGCYLASTPTCSRFYGLEGSEGRMALARANFESCGLSLKSELILGNINKTLPELLERGPSLDLAWIDADHREDSTLLYLESLLPNLRAGSLVVFDDIRWSHGMFDAWRRIREWPGFACTVDLGRMGLGIWATGGDKPRLWDFAAEMTWPRPVRVVSR